MKHGSLFSGLGGFDLAAEWMGWENIFHCEWMEFPRKVLDYHFPNADSHIDICKTDFKKYANKIDILTGGFPCQPFSMAGKRKGTDDERYLWGEMLRAIQEIKPTFVIAENVFGITNIDGGMVFEQVCLDLEAEGYEVQPFVIPAAAKNAPHRRDRVWFIAFKNTLLSRCIHRELEQEGTEVRKFGDTCSGSAERIHLSKGNAANSNSNGLNQRWGHDGICKDDDGGNTQSKWSTNSKDIDGCSSNGLFEKQSTISTRVSEQANAEKNKTTTANGICGVDKTNHTKGIIRKNNDTIDKSGALVQEGCKRIFSPINRGLEYIKESFRELGKMGLSVDIRRINTMEGNATDTKSSRSERQCIKGQRQVQSDGRDSRTIPTNFQEFPTQPPICGGDDGIPRELDGITFPKWRAESIKGYGNAIVPQIALEIFKQLEKIYLEL